MLSTEIKENAKGKHGCSLCSGDGMYIFEGTKIFCESCHGDDGVEALWASVESMLSKKLHTKTVHKNTRT